MSSADGSLPATALEPARGKAAMPPRRPRSLARRLSIMVFLASFGTVLAACVISYVAMESTLYHAEDQVLLQRAETALEWLDSEPYDEALLFHEITENTIAPREIYLRVFNASGSFSIETPEMSEKTPRALFPDATALARGESRAQTLYNEKGEAFRSLIMHAGSGTAIGETDVYVHASSNISLDDEAIVWFRNLLIVTVVVSMLICLWLGRMIAEHGLKPLTRVAEATRGLDARNLSYRLDRHDMPEEIDRLAGDFNNMMGRLETAYTGLRHYADNVAHELRGPLNKMLLEAEVTLNRKRTADEYRAALESCIEEGQQLTRIVNGILFLARTDQTTRIEAPERLVLTHEVAAVVALFAASAAAASIDLDIKVGAGLRFAGDPTLFRRALANLVGNALAHSPPGSVIGLTGRAEGDRLVISVTDEGSGIEAAHLPHVFDRFFRADGVRTHGENLGLGLPISRSIIRLHDGELTIVSVKNVGTTATISLPRTL